MSFDKITYKGKPFPPDNLGVKLYGYSTDSFKDLGEVVDSGTNTMYFQHMHYLNDHCRPSYECWENNSLPFRIKYRIFHLWGLLK